MDQRYNKARDVAHDFWTKIAYITLDASLARRAAAIAALNDASGDKRMAADALYESRVSVANEAYASSVGEAKTIRDTACAVIVEAYALSVEAPKTILEAAQKLNDSFLIAHRKVCENVHRLATALAQEEYEVALDEATSDAEREEARFAYHAAKRVADTARDEGYARGTAMHRIKNAQATEAFAVATATARTTCGEATGVHNKTFAAVNHPAQAILSAALDAAHSERETRKKEIDAEHQTQWDAIQSQYAVERRLRVAGLRTSRVVVDAYFNWLSSFAPPAE